jgi:hypothetical protein
MNYVTGVRETDMNMMIALDIKSLENYCLINQDGYKICTNRHFWKLKFEKDNLPFPLIHYTTPAEWISSYIYTHKVMSYTQHVTDYILEGSTVRIQFNNLYLFENVIDKESLKKCYLAWQQFLPDYLNYVKNQYDDEDSYGVLFIEYKENKFNLKFRIENKYIISNSIDHDQVIYILYTLISSYKYPYFRDNNEYDIIPYTYI